MLASNVQPATFLISRGPSPLDRALNKGAKKRTGTSATHFAVLVGHTHLKIPQTPTSKTIAWATIFARPHSFGGSAPGAPKSGHFFQIVVECALNPLLCFAVL